MQTSSIVLAHEPPFALGQFEIRPADCLIVGGDDPVHVEPRVMQLLVALWRADEEVLSRADLIDFCWDGRQVGDDAINRAVALLRRHAARDAGGAFIVDTIPRVGHRLRLKPHSRKSQWHGWWIAAAAAAGLTVGAMAAGAIDFPDPLEAL